MTDKQNNNLSCQFSGENYHEKDSQSNFEAKIIINGVDVSKCQYYKKEDKKCYCENGKNCVGWESQYYFGSSNILCEDNDSCHFKQSARKDDRIRELEEKLSNIAELCNEIEQRNFTCPSHVDCDNCPEKKPCNEQFQNDREIYFKKAQQIKQIAQGE